MRILICDQESEMLETIARSFEVDTATSKATCVDLMRANPFDVLVASERLSDGSGLELLSHVATRWPDTLRVLAIEAPRLKLLRGKLGPFRLHATLPYPMDVDELERVLERMSQLLSEPEALEPEEDAPKVQKVPVSQQPAQTSSQRARGPAPTPRQTSQSARARPPLGSPVQKERAPVRRNLGNYTPLGTADDEQLRIVEREFDQTVAPLAARAIRTREEASRPRTSKERVGLLANHIRDTLRRLLKR
jgi:DNA-binding NarL/FixJ family response regulator